MKKYIILILLIYRLVPSHAQNFSDSVNIYIDRLNWESLIIAPTYGTQLTINPDAQKLVNTFTPGILSKLYKNLDRPEKAVIIHIILTKRLEHENESFSYSIKGDTLYYEYNGLLWSYDTKIKQFGIKKSDIKKLKKHWCDKISN